jgi:hypothetical protein
MAATQPKHLHSRWRHPLLLAVLLLWLCASQVLTASHVHAPSALQHDDCVLCHFQGAGFDAIPATGLTVASAAHAAPFAVLPVASPALRQARPRARAPPHLG